MNCAKKSYSKNMNINKVMLYGNLTRDPELKQIQTGSSVCSFSIATNRTWTGKDGQKQEEVQFHNIVAWGKTAELIVSYMTKGSGLFVEGRLQTREWQAKDGTKRYTTEIVAEKVQFGPRSQGAGGKVDKDDSGFEQIPPKEDLAEIQVENLPF